jgi:hypothetical protein
MTVLERAKTLHALVARQFRSKAPWNRLAFDGWLASATPLSTLRRTLLEKRRLLTNFSFSNLLALGVPGGGEERRWSTSQCRVTRLRITLPCVPPQAVSLTAVWCGNEAIFNFNYKASAIDVREVERLMRLFDEALKPLPSPSLDGRAVDAPLTTASAQQETTDLSRGRSQ